MRLLLDTTYFLPAIGISIRGIPRDALIKLISKGHHISISEITIFELSKGAKHITNRTLTAERASRGIRAIIYDERIEKTPIHDTSILLLAFKLRRLLNDFIDCLILSSAIIRNDILITENDAIHELWEKREFQELIQTINPEFKIQRVKNVI